MDLDELLDLMNRAERNLAKLDAVWARAEPQLPAGTVGRAGPSYDGLRRSWEALLPGLPPIDGWTVTVELPDADELLEQYAEAAFASIPTGHLSQVAAEPGRQLAEYRFRLGRARSRVVSKRLVELAKFVDELLAGLIPDLPEDPIARLDDPREDQISAAVDEIEILLGEGGQRNRRWNDLHRHLTFRQVCDWQDIANFDWPAVRADVEQGGLSESDPLPMPDVDLGRASARGASAPTFELRWEALGDEQFERLLFDLLRDLPGYQNVEWLMKTRAPDRGRDLQLERVLHDAGGTTRTERVLVQAKHWTSKSVGPLEIASTLATVGLWEPPVIRALIIATSGRFTTDATAVAENHNASGKMPFVELWANSRLEVLLNRRPDLIQHYGLR